MIPQHETAIKNLVTALFGYRDIFADTAEHFAAHPPEIISLKQVDSHDKFQPKGKGFTAR